VVMPVDAFARGGPHIEGLGFLAGPTPFLFDLLARRAAVIGPGADGAIIYDDISSVDELRVVG